MNSIAAVVTLLFTLLASGTALANDTLISAEELLEIYTPPANKTKNTPLTRGIRGIAGVRKSKESTQSKSNIEEPGQARLSFNNILFDVNSAVINKRSYAQLDEVGKAISVVMQTHQNVTFTVEGHTDSAGAETRNKELSTERADAIATYLSAYFVIDRSRLRIIGFGELHPVADNDSATGRKLNRRVTIVGNWNS